MRAATGGHARIVRSLLAAGANIELRDRVQLTALGRAVDINCSSDSYVTIVQDLLAAGAQVNIPNIDGGTPLRAARRNPEHSPYKASIEKLLLQYGAKE